MTRWIASAVVSGLFAAGLHWLLPGMHWGAYLIAFLIATGAASQHL
jgi:hypothetical protein